MTQSHTPTQPSRHEPGDDPRPDAAITFDALTVTYPSSTTPAVNNFNLTVPRGRTTVLLGSSGCGKTTLLRTVNRLVTPTSGIVTVNGKDIADEDPVKLRRSIGYVLQNAGLLPHKTVVDNIASVLRLNKVPKSEAKDAAADTAELVGLSSDMLNRYPSQLSGGQQQRAGVARALAADPEILLMDEPFGAVDPIVRRGLQDLLLDLQARLSKTIVLVTHDVSEAMTLADHVVLLREGAQIAQQGTPKELALNPADEFVQDFLQVATRDLSIESQDGQKVVVDARGGIVGVLHG